MHKIEYVFNCTNKFNFPKEKLDIKDRAVLICHNCGYLGDDLENFAVYLLFYFAFLTFYN
jgi:hypothetical protein